MKWLDRLLRKEGEVTVKHHKIDYIRNCVEERVGHAISDQQYKKAVEATYRYRADCISMQDRINAIVRYL